MSAKTARVVASFRMDEMIAARRYASNRWVGNASGSGDSLMGIAEGERYGDASAGTEGGGPALGLAALVGTSSEWYDFFLYATAAAVVFPTTFFAATLDPFVALLASFSTFAVGFIARPLGAVFFGHLGDRAGRKTAFATALVVMGLATTLIGLLPPYSRVGALAPLALVLLRLVQGFAVGGQWGVPSCWPPRARRARNVDLPRALRRPVFRSESCWRTWRSCSQVE